MFKLLPMDIYVLLHIYMFPEPVPGQDSNSVSNALAILLTQELVKEATNRAPKSGGFPLFSITAKGRVYINMMCITPLPQLEWADPRK